MKHARLLVAAAAILAVGALAPGKAEAQLKFGAHVAYLNDGINSEDGEFGLGARVGIDPPLIPFSFWAHGDYYFPDCGEFDCGYQTFGADAVFSPLPFPVISPFLSGGVLFRRASFEGNSSTEPGFAAGVGVTFGALVNGIVEIRREFFADEEGGNLWVARAGIIF